MDCTLRLALTLTCLLLVATACGSGGLVPNLEDIFVPSLVEAFPAPQRALEGSLSVNGAAPKKLPPCSPNLNAYAERFIQTLKHECLSHFIVFGERHLNHLVDEFVDYYHTVRPHQGIENRTPIQSRDEPGSGPVRCESRLGGVLKHYYRAA